jgi:hypothetical protein
VDRLVGVHRPLGEARESQRPGQRQRQGEEKARDPDPEGRAPPRAVAQGSCHAGLSGARS